MKRLLGFTRYVVLLGVAGSLFSAAVLFLTGFLQVVTIASLGRQAIGHPKELKLLAIVIIQLADYFLIATALYIVAVGLYELFIGEVNLPERLGWLRITSLEELKDRLTGVVVTVLAVTFLGIVTEWEGTEIQPLGVALALVILAVGVYGWLSHGLSGRR